MKDPWFWCVGIPTLVVGSLFAIAMIGERVLAFREYMGWKARTPYVG